MLIVSSSIPQQKLKIYKTNNSPKQSIAFQGVPLEKTTNIVKNKGFGTKLKNITNKFLDIIFPLRVKSRIKAEAKRAYIKEWGGDDPRDCANAAIEFEQRWDYFNCFLTKRKEY